MFKIEDDIIKITRANRAIIDFSLPDYIFKTGDIVEFKIYGKSGLNKPPLKTKQVIVTNDCSSLDIEFREYVKANMTHPDWLGDFSKNDLIYMLNNNSKIWIYYLKEEPICSMMLIPYAENALSKFELDLDYKDVVDYGPMFVNSKYIGNGLQY